MRVGFCVRFALPALLLAFGNPKAPAAIPSYAQRSISRSQQFTIYCPDVGLRMAVTSYVETLKSYVLEEFGLGDHWKIPIVLNLRRPPTTSAGVPLCLVRLFNTDEGSKLEIDIALRENQFKEVHFPQQIIRTILLELAYRTRPPKDGEYLSQPPSWLVEGFAERFQSHATDSVRNAALFRQLIDTGRLPNIRDFLKSNVDVMDSTSQAVYSACASSLVEMLASLPEGKASLSKIARSYPDATGDPASFLVSCFPSLGGADKSLEKWWTLGLARSSTADRYLGLSVPDTNARIVPMLTLHVVTDEKTGAKTSFALADYKKFLKFRTAAAALFARGNDFASLQTKAHPLLRPVVFEYQKVVADLARGKTRRVDATLKELENYRTMIVDRMDKIADYLNWFEATQMPERSGAFDNYLKAAAALENAPAPKRNDPISRYVDQVAREFE